MKLIPIQPENITLALRDVRRYLEEALSYTDGKYNMTDVLDGVRQGMQVLWVVYNEEKEKAAGCLVTEILAYPRAKALSIFLLGGNDFDEIITLLDELKEYAIGVGCKTLEFYGRSGWEKMLKPYGFEKTHIVMRANIKD